jgi:hypothetical protein
MPLVIIEFRSNFYCISFFQLQLIQFIKRECDYGVIAKKLRVSPHSLEEQISKLCTKLDIQPPSNLASDIDQFEMKFWLL